RIPAHGMKNVVAPHPHVARQRITVRNYARRRKDRAASPARSISCACCRALQRRRARDQHPSVPATFLRYAAARSDLPPGVAAPAWLWFWSSPAFLTTLSSLGRTSWLLPASLPATSILSHSSGRRPARRSA